MGTINNSKPLSFEDMEDVEVTPVVAAEVVAEVVNDLVSATATATATAEVQE